MCMILGWLAKNKIHRTAEWWFSTSFSGGFGPEAGLFLPRVYWFCSFLEAIKLFLLRSSAQILRRFSSTDHDLAALDGSIPFLITVFSVYQWSVFALSATIRIHPR
jgi:hypothetical protein